MQPGQPIKGADGQMIPSGPDMTRVRQNFDQEAAAVLSTRLAVDRTKMENVADARPIRWVDRTYFSIVDSSYFFYE
jgi:hypothetical protein